MQKQSVIYRGKSKTLYTTEHPERLILEFRDDTSSLNGRHVEQIACKGAINNQFNHFIMNKLQQAGIPTQMERLLSDNQALVKKLTMLPVECVVRNRAAGSLCRRLGIAEGTVLTPPTFELFLKNDALDDPMINEAYCITFDWATEAQCTQIKALSFQVNEILSALFDKAGLWLVDFKLEFGLLNHQMILGDELSPDSCRIWDQKSLTKLDKDRFRQGLGGVVDAYQEVAQRLGVVITA